MWNKIVCLLLGHDFLETREYYGTLNNGRNAFYFKIDKCQRCGKDPNKQKDTEAQEDNE